MSQILRPNKADSEIDHGSLGGLDGDDHPQYILADGTRDFTGNQSMGGNDLLAVNRIVFSTNPMHVHEEGCIHWDVNDKTLNIDTEQNEVAIQVGQESVVRCTNKTGSTILNGRIVYINGAQGNRPTIALAESDSEALSDSVIGVATHDINNNNMKKNNKQNCSFSEALHHIKSGFFAKRRNIKNETYIRTFTFTYKRIYPR